MEKSHPEKSQKNVIAKKIFKEAVTENKLSVNQQRTPSNNIEKDKAEKRTLKNQITNQPSSRHDINSHSNGNIEKNNTEPKEQKIENEGK